MRWGYLAPRLLITFCFWAILHFGLDPALKSITKFSAEMVMDSRVDLEELDTGFFPPRVELEEVAVADSSNPGFNLIEFDKLKMKLEGKPLLRRSCIIESATLTGLEFGTVREGSGERESHIDFSLPSFKIDGFDISLGLKPEDWLKGLTENVKNSIDPDQLESIRLAKIKQQQWKARFQEKEKQLEQLKKSIKQIESQVKDAGGNAIDKLQAYHDAALNAEQLRKEMKRLRDELKDLPKVAQADYKEIQNASLRDQNRIKNQVQVLKLDPKEISKALLGPELEQKIKQTVQYLSWLKENLSDKMALPSPERIRGIDFAFEKKNPLPKYLCRNLNISGKTTISNREFEFKGILHDLTSDPKIHQKPLVIEVKGVGEDDFIAKAVIDQSREVPIYNLRFQYHQNVPPVIHLGQGSDLAINLSADQTRLESQVEIENGQVTGQIQLVQSDCRFDLNSSDESQQKISLVSMLGKSLNNINALKTKLALKGSLDNPQWTISSNLGEHLSEGLSGLFQEEFEKQKTEIVKMIDEKVLLELKEFEKLLNGEYSQIFAELNIHENDAKKLIQKVAGGNELKLDSLFR